MAQSIWAFGLLTIIVLPYTLHAETGERTDVYLGLYALGSWPYNRDAFSQTGPAPDTTVGNGAGAGLKVAVFPTIGKGFLGLELESFGSSSNISVPLTTGPAAGTVGRTNLWVFNSMANLIFRYPGSALIPYIGIGAGLSQGVLSGANIPGRSDQDFESSATFGYQFLAGLQGNVSKRIFLFGEYKYLSADYHWQRLALDYRSQYALIGIGLRF